jgi:hypothetical protein
LCRIKTSFHTQLPSRGWLGSLCLSQVNDVSFFIQLHHDI